MAAGIAFVTMGCAKNEVDSAHMADRLVAAGYDLVEDPRHADVVIVNTCSFIQEATEESIEAVLEAAGYDNVANGDAHLVVAGCMPARYRDDLQVELPEASSFVPCAEEDGIVAVVDALLADRKGPDLAAETALRPAGRAERCTRVPSAYVKISDGCDRFCSYCAIPRIRGRYRSRIRDDIAHEVAQHVGRGVREIVLIAQDTGRWGDDFDQPDTLANLVRFLAQAHPDTWFRIMYVQPEGVTDELIDTVAMHENVCSYFDIPFQHCDPNILSAMNRSGSRTAHLALIGRVRARIPDAVLRTTLIAGFPGETDEQFEELCDFVEEAALDYVGVFPYSREEGTRAYDLPDQVDEDEKLARAQRIRDVADAVSSVVIAGRIGTKMDVLVCGREEDGQPFGRAHCQAPDVDGVTYVPRGETGDVVTVVITDTLLYEMEGEVVV